MIFLRGLAGIAREYRPCGLGRHRVTGSGSAARMFCTIGNPKPMLCFAKIVHLTKAQGRPDDKAPRKKAAKSSAYPTANCEEKRDDLHFGNR
jgi:hypothetical protein